MKGLHQVSCSLLIGAAAGAVPGPVQGVFRVVSMGDDKQTIVIDDLIKRSAMRGEVVFKFDDDKFSFGMWSLGKALDDKKPGQSVVALCRSQVTLSPAWNGKSFSLSSRIEATGMTTALYAAKTQAGGKTKISTMGKSLQCSFWLEKSTYAITIVKSDDAGASEISIKSDKVVMHLVRTKVPEGADAEQLVTAVGSE